MYGSGKPQDLALELHVRLCETPGFNIGITCTAL
jgi:hypothetical protein